MDKPAQRTDYSAYLARLVVLAASFGAGLVLNHLSTEKPLFGFLILSGVVLVCIGVILGPHTQAASGRMAVPLFDLAWISFAMYLTDGLSSFLLPLLYIVVATAAMRGDRWEVGMSLGGALVAVFVLAHLSRTGSNMPLAVAQATLLAAAALAVRLTIAATAPQVLATARNEKLYHELLQMTSDAVFNLDPDSWKIIDANPAATATFDGSPGHALTSESFDEVINFKDRAFLKTCRERLARAEPVRDAVTYGQASDGRELMLRLNLIPCVDNEERGFIQAIIEVTNEEDAAAEPRRTERDDFSVNYIPSLTHELNNHLAAIRLAAELAATTGREPNYEEIQQQVDHCQEVLQTVVLQILRASAPAHVPEQVPTASVQSVIERALLLTRPQVLTCGVQLQLKVASSLPQVAVFSHEMQEALVRIIIGSVKSMAAHEPPRTLGLSAECRDGYVEVILHDLGEGLNSREMAIINGKRNIMPRAEDRNWEMVRDAVCRFGGDIQANNGLNGGMRIRILLPVHEAVKAS